MASTQKIIQEMVYALAERYNFDATEALAFVVAEKRKASPALARAIKAVQTTEAKIAELEQKIADKKVKNVEKSEETLASLRTKLAEQQERVNTFDGATAPKAKKADAEVVQEDKPKKAKKVDTDTEADAPQPKKKRATKKAEPVTDTETEADAPQPKKKRATKKAETDSDTEGARYGKRLAASAKKELLSAFEEAGVEWKDTYVNDYKAFANAMADEAWNSKAPLDHMKDFAGSKKVAIPEAMPEDAEVVTLTYNQLLKAKVAGAYGAGVYWDLTKKRFVKGPDAVDDEDATEAMFHGSVYMVGETSKRVYMISDDADVFVGFVGVGAFKDMEMPM